MSEDGFISKRSGHRENLKQCLFLMLSKYKIILKIKDVCTDLFCNHPLNLGKLCHNLIIVVPACHPVIPVLVTCHHT